MNQEHIKKVETMEKAMNDAPERIWWNAAPMPHSYTSTVQFAGGIEYTRADLPPKVKPLVWGYHPAGAIAAPPTGFAYIIDTRMKGRVYMLKGLTHSPEFYSMDEAKAAAQADYEIRVLSALEGHSPRNPA